MSFQFLFFGMAFQIELYENNLFQRKNAWTRRTVNQEFFHKAIWIEFHSKIDKIALSQLYVSPQGLGCTMSKTLPQGEELYCTHI